MISKEQLNRCIDILAELNANTERQSLKKLILELGYIIKQELDLVKEWEKTCNKEKMKRDVTQLDVMKLLEDNTQLCKENETLLKNLRKLEIIAESKIPDIQSKMILINQNILTFNELLANH